MTSDAIFQLPERVILRLVGPDTRDLLQRVITADVENFPVGTARPGALLTPQGKIICDFMMFSRENGIDIDVAEIAGAALLKRLTMYRLKADVTLSHETALHALWSTAAFQGASEDPRLPGQLWRAVSDADHETRPLDAIEIPAGIPAFGRDYGEAEVFPTDVNLDVYGGVGWTKGCFIGQEVVSRMKRRGTIRKRSLAVTFDGGAPPAGTTLRAGDTSIGEITSSHESQAVALVRLDKLEKADGSLSAGGIAASTIVPEALEPEPAAERI